MLARLVLGVALLALVVACASEPITLEGSDTTEAPTPTPTGEPSPDQRATNPDAVWFEVLAVSQEGGEIGEVRLIEQDLDLREAWERYSFEGEPPEVDFTQHIVVAVISRFS